MTVTKETKLMDLVEKYPEESGGIFFSLGLGCMGCMLAQSETIGDACAAHGLDVNEVCTLFNKTINK